MNSCRRLFSRAAAAMLVLAGISLPSSAERGKINIQLGGEEERVAPAYRRPLPVYIAELSNINDYSLFANAGWDGNWYAGFNVCWIEELPPPPGGEYRRAFVGAKLGRAKSRLVPGKPAWEKEPIPGDFYVALSSKPSWKSSQKYFLTDAADVPLEGDFENAVEGTGESRWFWAEVPLEAVNFDGPNYVALWSPKDYFVSAASSPILAGGRGSQKVNSWLNNDVRGYAPLDPETALKTPITMFEPAIALKLVPEGTHQNIFVRIAAVENGRGNTANKTFVAAVSGEEIEKAWLEISIDGAGWIKHGRFIYNPPYMLTLRANELAYGKVKVRVAVNDIWGNTAASEPVEILVSK